MKALLTVLLLAPAACGGGPDHDVGDVGDVGADASGPAADGASDAGAVPEPDPDATAPATLQFTAITFNTGTSAGPSPEVGFGSEQAAWSDAHYGNGLAWEPFVEDTAAFFAAVDPEVVAFQEIFWPGECPDVPADARVGFVCEGWADGDPTVAERVLGPGYQAVCHPGKPDKCAGVKRAFGTFRGCEGDLCLDGAMDGYPVDGCGSGARVARAVIDIVGGGDLTLVTVHGTSGFTEHDSACRVGQVDQVFVDLGDGEPGANGARNLILGDLNTDPGRLTEGDPSAARWLDFTGEGHAFHFVTDVGEDATPSYALLFNIDHVVSDSFDGACWIAGEADEQPTLGDASLSSFDHRPIVCPVSESQGRSGEQTR